MLIEYYYYYLDWLMRMMYNDNNEYDFSYRMFGVSSFEDDA